jgi:hypothetical protein
MKSPSYEKEDPHGYLPNHRPPVPFNVASEGRFRISEAVAGRKRDMLPVAFEPSQRCCSTPCGEETQQPQGQGFQPSLARRAASQSLPEGREDAVSAAAYWFERTDPRLLLEAAGHGAYENGALFRPLGDVGLMIDARWWRPSRAAYGRR